MSGVNEQQPSLDEVVIELARSEIARLHTSLPAVIVFYDHATQRATVQPAVRSRYLLPDGTSETARMPQVADVPVLFPAGGSCSIAWPLAQGDRVTLLIAERSLVEWKESGADDCSAANPRRFDLGDAMVLPHPPGGATLAEVEAGVLVVSAPLVKLGDKSATDFVALAALVKSQLDLIQSSFDLHVHPTPVGPTLATATPILPLASVAATKVKAV